MADDDYPECLGCARPNRGRGLACEACRCRAADMLAELPHLAELLPLAMVPGGTARSDGMKSRKPDAAPLGVNLAAFNLLSAGAVDYDLREADSQVGVLPLAVWLGAWYDDWEPRFDFGTIRVPIHASREAIAGSPALMRHLLTSAKLVISRDDDGIPTTRPISDTLDAEHAARYGRPATWAINTLIAALASRLDAACDEHEDIGNFLVGLRTMVGACRSVVGEHSDLMFIGRCPETRLDRETGEESTCGGALWQDPYVSKIACPRCKHEWVEKLWLRLGAAIRKAWPKAEAMHQFAGQIVILTDPPDRYWSCSCTCGQWLDDGEPVKVRGNKLDAKGRFQLHVDEAMAPLAVAIEELIEA